MLTSLHAKYCILAEKSRINVQTYHSK